MAEGDAEFKAALIVYLRRMCIRIIFCTLEYCFILLLIDLAQYRPVFGLLAFVFHYVFLKDFKKAITQYRRDAAPDNAAENPMLHMCLSLAGWMVVYILVLANVAGRRGTRELMQYWMK